MAKELKKIFDPGVDEVVQNFTIESWHVSQSVDAFTGVQDYDITISGSLTISGSTFISGSPEATGGGYSTLVINDTTGQIYYTGSYGGGTTLDTSSFLPAPPDRSLQFNDDGSWGGTNLFYLTGSGKYTTDENYTTSLINLIGVPAVGGITSILSWGQNEVQGWLTNASSETGSIVIGHPGNASGRIGGIFISRDNLATPDIYVSASGQVGLHLNYTGVSPTFTKDVQIGDAAVTASTEVYGDFYLPAIPNTVTTNIIGFDTTTGKLSYYNTGSFGGGGGTPAGTSSMVQYNNLGAFAGDAGFTYASASQVLTIDKSTTITSALPNLRLLGNSSTAGALSGVIAGSATIANSTPASLQFKNAVAHGLGDYGTDVLIKTAFSDGTGTTVERTAVNFTSSGDTHFGYDVFTPNLNNTSQANVVGFNSSTGQLTYFTTPGTLTRPTSATNIIYDVDIPAVGWTFSSVTNGNPTSAGQISVNTSTATSVTTVKVNKTANGSSDQSTQLEGLAVSSSFTLVQAGGGVGTGEYRIVTTTDNTSYMTYAVTYMGGGSGTYDVASVVTFETNDSDTFYEHVLNDGYNYLNIRNNGDGDDAIRFKAPNNISPGSKVMIEAQINASSQTIGFTYQARSGSVSPTGQVNKALYTIGDSGTATAPLLDSNDIAVLEFTSWGTGSSVNYGLVPSGYIQVYNG